MILPSSILKPLTTRSQRVLGGLRKRTIIDVENGRVYLERFYLLEILGCEVVIHHILQPDSDRRLHNHPWRWSFSLILAGGYVEERQDNGNRVRVRSFRRGQLNIIPRRCYHRISELLGDEVWTLFVHRRDKQPWHFSAADGERTPR